MIIPVTEARQKLFLLEPRGKFLEEVLPPHFVPQNRQSVHPLLGQGPGLAHEVDEIPSFSQVPYERTKYRELRRKTLDTRQIDCLEQKHPLLFIGKDENCLHMPGRLAHVSQVQTYLRSRQINNPHARSTRSPWKRRRRTKHDAIEKASEVGAVSTPRGGMALPSSPRYKKFSLARGKSA